MYQMMQNMMGSIGAWCGGGMLLGGVISILVIVALVLLIAWLWKQIKK